jgi:hypothetical protein
MSNPFESCIQQFAEIDKNCDYREFIDSLFVANQTNLIEHLYSFSPILKNAMAKYDEVRVHEWHLLSADGSDPEMLNILHNYGAILDIPGFGTWFGRFYYAGIDDKTIYDDGIMLKEFNENYDTD